MHNDWFFNRFPDGTWEWHQRGSTTEDARRSGRRFPTMLECIADAAQNGYPTPGASSLQANDADEAEPDAAQR